MMNIFATIAVGLCALSMVVELSANPTGAQMSQPVPRKEVQQFVTVMAQVKSHYIKPVDNPTLFNNAIKGMVSRLDPHSTYLDKKDMQRLHSTMSGRFAGIGIEIIPDHGIIKVITPLDDTPAFKAGIKPGDYIIRIDNSLVEGMTLDDIVGKIRGPKNSKVTLTILRRGEKPFQLTLKRTVIKIKNIKSKLYDKHFGYVRITHFQKGTKKALVKALRNLQNKSHGSLQGLVIDLRNNPGGLLTSAVEVSDVFLDSKKLKYNQYIVYTKGRSQRIENVAKSRSGDWMMDRPIVVLINSGSASASEIVAGALQDHHRAIIMGTKSFGKGSVQTIFPISQNSALKLTTHLYYTPSGHKIQAIGITPNVIVNDVALAKKSQQPSTDPIMEAQLNGHIKKSKQNKISHNSKHAGLHSPLATKDYQLYQALSLLKGMVVMKKTATAH